MKSMLRLVRTVALPMTAAGLQATMRWSSVSTPVPPDHQLAPGPYRKVGNILIVVCVDHPFKHSWEINRALRDLWLEYKGQARVLSDTPFHRERLFRVRHIVKVDMMTTDEAKDMLGIPRGITFTELLQQTPRNFGPGPKHDFDFDISFADLAETRRMRLQDIAYRDAVELRLLREKKKAIAEQQNNGSTASP